MNPSRPLPPAPARSPAPAAVRWRAAIALSALLLTGACGGGGGAPPPTASGLPDQTGCAFRYTLTSNPVLIGVDPLLDAQWHLANTGQSGGIAGEDLRARAAWGITRGEGARVAVIDDAIEIVHPDLVANVVGAAGYNYRPAVLGNPYPLPCAADEDHGTAVAGVILARDNNLIGGAGVAPRAALVGYNPLSTGFSADIADALGRGLSDTGVFNNSWGSPDDGTLHRVDASFQSAIDRGTASGRGGRGAVYVFPAGNGGCYATRPGSGACIGETAGMDGYLNHPGVMVACTVDHRGRKPRYAETGANLLVCGPGSNDGATASITTLAPQGGFRSQFNGSSAAAPMVSGVAALMLAHNPLLTWRDVRLILAQTARRNDAADPGWVNGPAGLAHHPSYGFGVADAQAALAAARNWPSVGGSASLRSCGPYVRTPGLALPDVSGTGTTTREDSLTVGAECQISKIEYVEIDFSASHPYSGDLRIRLISPGGLVSELAAERVCEGVCGQYDGWRFGAVRHLNESPGGTWRLQVTDAQAGDVGTWQAWGLRFQGR